MVDSGNHVMCADHFERLVYPRCRQCGRLQSATRKDYLYCEECRDDAERRRHGYWYALRQKGISGPYGEGFQQLSLIPEWRKGEKKIQR